MTVPSAAIRASEQWPVGALPDGSVDGSRGAWCQRDQGGLVALPDDPDNPVAIGECQVGQVGTARFRYAQGVECQQACEYVAVPTRQPGLDEERAELGAVESKPSGFLGDLRPANVDRRGVLEQLLLDASHGRTRSVRPA